MKIAPLTAVLVSGFLILGAGCANEPDKETAQPAPTAATTGSETDESETPRLCDAARDIQQLDDEGQARLNEIMSAMLSNRNKPGVKKRAEEEMQKLTRYMSSQTPRLVDAYDRMEEVVPADLKKDVAITREFSVDVAEAMGDMKTIDDFDRLGAVMKKAGAIRAASSVLRLDAMTRRECDITLAD